MLGDMAEKSFCDLFPQEMKEAIKEAEKYSEMPFDKRLILLEKLKENKNHLEKQVSGVDTRILILESMEDIEQYKIKNDEMAMALLYDLKDEESIHYKELIGEDNLMSKFFAAYIFRLKAAEMIDIKNDSLVELTEKGKNFLEGIRK